MIFIFLCIVLITYNTFHYLAVELIFLYLMLLLIALSLRLLSFYSYSAFLKNKLLFIIQFIIIQYHIIGLVEVKF
jgi:hypothetical protein